MMLPLAILQWRRDQATFQATDETWQELLRRVRGLSPPPAHAVAIIEQALPPPDRLRRGGATTLRRLTFPMPDAEIVYLAAQDS